MSLFSFNAIESEINYFLKLADDTPFNEHEYYEQENERILINLFNPHLFNDLGFNFKSIEDYYNKLDKLVFYEKLTGDKSLNDSFLDFLEEVWGTCESEEDSDENKDKHIIQNIISLKQDSSFNLIKSFSKKLKFIFRLKINKKTITELYGYKISDDGTELIPLENRPTITLGEAINQFAPTQIATASKNIKNLTKLADTLEEITSEIDYLSN